MSVAHFQYDLDRHDLVDLSLLGTLSTREREVLELASLGFMDKEIGQKLDVSLNTLRTYWKRIRQKIGNGSRLELTAAYSNANILNHNHNFIYDFHTGSLLASDEINEKLRLPFGQWHPGSLYESFYHPDDRVEASHLWHDIYVSKDNFHSIRYRIVTEDGVCACNTVIIVERDALGLPIRYLGKSVTTLLDDSGQDIEVRIGRWMTTKAGEEISYDHDCMEMLSLLPSKNCTKAEFAGRLFPARPEEFDSFLSQVEELDGGTGHANLHLSLADDMHLAINLSAHVVNAPNAQGRIHGRILAAVDHKLR